MTDDCRHFPLSGHVQVYPQLHDLLSAVLTLCSLACLDEFKTALLWLSTIVADLDGVMIKDCSELVVFREVFKRLSTRVMNLCPILVLTFS